VLSFRSPSSHSTVTMMVTAVVVTTASLFAGRQGVLPGRYRIIRSDQGRIWAYARPIAVALRGDIYVVDAAGGVLHQLTSYGLNSSPLLSPNGRRIAYLSTSRSFIVHGRATTHGVWVVPVDGRPNGSSARKVTRTDPTIDRGNLTWSPDGRYLAYDEGATVVVATPGGGYRSIVLHTGVPFQSGASMGMIAWSPDSRRVAILIPDAAARWATIMTARIADDVETSARVMFPGGLPDGIVLGNDLYWSGDGHHLLFDTVTIGAAGGRIADVWRVSDSGGHARLLARSATPTTHSHLPEQGGSPFLTDATRFVPSSDGRYTATDPVDDAGMTQLWITGADGTHGYPLPLKRVSRRCVLTQFEWLTNSRGLAFVTLCGASGTGMVEAHLDSIALGDAALRDLYTVSYLVGKQGPLVTPIDLAPSSRSLAG